MILSSLPAAKYRGVLPDRRPLCRFATFPPIAGESAPRGNGECGFCGSLIRHLWLAVCIQTTNSGTVSNSLAAESAHDFLPVGREKSVIFSLPVHLCSAEHRWGRGCVGCVSIASMVTMWVGQGALPPVSSQPSQSSRRGLNTIQYDNSSAVGTAILVSDSILIFKPSVIHIQIPSDSIGFVIHR